MGYVYKYTHITTGKWYIGSHNGSNPKYSGSGLLWAHAKRKYGLENFVKEILYEGNEYRQKEEEILKSLDAANDPLSYNMKNESIGGSFPGERNGMYGKKHSPEQRYKCGNAFRGKTRPDFSLKIRGKGNPMYGRNDQCYGIINWSKTVTKGKTFEEIHGEELGKILKKRISQSNKGRKKNNKIKVCPHCGLQGKGPNMSRYHFSKCHELSLSEEQKLERQKYNEQIKLLLSKGYKRPKQVLSISGERNGMYGKKHSESTKLKMSLNRKGKTGWNKGLKIKYDTKTCPHCGLQGKGPNMKRYHFDKCKAPNQK